MVLQLVEPGLEHRDLVLLGPHLDIKPFGRGFVQLGKRRLPLGIGRVAHFHQHTELA